MLKIDNYTSVSYIVEERTGTVEYGKRQPAKPAAKEENMINKGELMHNDKPRQ